MKIHIVFHIKYRNTTKSHLNRSEIAQLCFNLISPPVGNFSAHESKVLIPLVCGRFKFKSLAESKMCPECQIRNKQKKDEPGGKIHMPTGEFTFTNDKAQQYAHSQFSRLILSATR